ncbi:hypothetical protein [uncultured Shimia sp.]|uniref:hypothetical protein n=1 Tax=uncultured Shimia sp. TaxID=573152 RepID=UPI00263A1D76|nr:hypothetical protein [uncultured Shimia sp.]
MQALKHIMIRGVLFLVPVVILGFVLVQVLNVTSAVAEIAEQFIPIERVAGVAVVNILVILLAVLLCFAAGLVSYLSVINDKVMALDRILAENVPGYSMVKGVFGSATKSEYVVDHLNPILVRFDDHEALAFEVERTGDKVTVFRPDIPSMLAGEIFLFSADRVTTIDLPAHQVMGILQSHGRKMSKVHEAIAKAAQG